MKQLSVIIVNYNVSHFLTLCLDSVFDALKNLDAEVIVVDNASSDTSCEVVRDKFPNVRLIANKDNVGFATANNQGVAIASGEYVCILNPDTVVGEKVFDNVYAFAKAKSKLGAIGVRLVDGTGKFLPECKRNLPTPQVAFEKLFGSGDTYYARDIEPQENGNIDILVGAFMFMQKSIYEEAGGFDEQYFMYGEDIDLSFTIKKLGYQNFYLGEEVVVHFKGESTSKNEVYRKRFYSAMKIFYSKHLKKNAIEAALVNAGLWYARNYHRKKREEIKCQENTATRIIKLISHNASLEPHISKLLTVSVTRDDNLEALKEDGEEWILDMNTLVYEDCIRFLIHDRPKDMTFKFIPKNCTFAIGSNSSEGRGMLLQW